MFVIKKIGQNFCPHKRQATTPMIRGRRATFRKRKRSLAKEQIGNVLLKVYKTLKVLIAILVCHKSHQTKYGK